MSNKKFTIFIKTTPASMGYLHKLDVDCSCCSYCISEDYPLCFHGTGCAVVEHVTEHIGKDGIEYNITNKSNPSASIIAKNIDALGRAHAATVKAIEYCTGKAK